jgi:predicted amidohydrolase
MGVMTVLKVATCQFPANADIEQNAGWMARQLREAARQGARVAHFPEGALSGYAGTDFETFTGYDWDTLDRATGSIRELAG